MSPSDKAILQLMHTPRVGSRTLADVLSKAAGWGLLVEDIVTGPAELLHRLGLRTTAGALAVARATADDLESRLHEGGVRLIVKGCPEYPSVLASAAGQEAPSVLFAHGPHTILNRPAVAFCGARDASPRGREIARACASFLAARGVNIVSGYANGIDLAAHAAALDSGGVTTFVLAEGILRFKSKPEVAPHLDEHNHLILSQFPPRLPWAVGSAMRRNITVLGLASAVVVVESGTTGGTFAAAESALKMKLPLFVIDYSVPPASAAGNRHFLASGAIPLRMKADGSPNLAGLWKTVEANGRGPGRSSSTAQPTLFDPLQEPI